MGWFDSMARSAPSIPTPPGSQALSAVTGGPQAASGMAGIFSGGAPAGPNSVLGLMGGQLLNQQPQSGPQPVPGMPPQKMPLPGTDWGGNPVGPITGAPSPFPYQPIPGTDWGGHPIPTNPDGSPIFTGGGKDSTGMPLITDNWNPDNRGSGQPINQPMSGYQAPGMATWTTAPGVPNGWQQGGIENPYGSAGQQPMGSLQSLGGGQLNQSGMVNLRGTDGTTKAVPQQDLAHWLSKGAVRV